MIALSIIVQHLPKSEAVLQILVRNVGAIAYCLGTSPTVYPNLNKVEHQLWSGVALQSSAFSLIKHIGFM